VAERLTDLMAAAMASMPQGLLIGEQAIAKFCAKSPRTLRRYAKSEGFPLWRWGKCCYSHPDAIGRWLMLREPRRRQWHQTAESLQKPATSP